MKLSLVNTCPTEWRFDYESTDPELENLYELAKANQWNVTSDNYSTLIFELPCNLESRFFCAHK